MSAVLGARVLRLLPMTILASGVLLGVKALEFGLMMVPGAGTDALPTAMVTAAQAATPPAADVPHGGAAGEHAAKGPSQWIPAPAVESLPVPSGPPPVSAAERDLLQGLRARRLELDAREKTLTEREGVLEAAEHRLTGRIGELSALQARLEQLDADRRAHDDANWSGIVKVYETMKPRDAAVIFNDMDMGVLLQVMDRMKDSKAALVLAAMQPDRARLLTTQLAARRTQSVTLPPAAVPSLAPAATSQSGTSQSGTSQSGPGQPNAS